MPNPAALMVKAILMLLVAVATFQLARQLATVRVTTISDGQMAETAVSPDDRVYEDEIQRAKRRAMPVYGLSVVSGLIGFSLMRKSLRVYRKTREA